MNIAWGSNRFLVESGSLDGWFPVPCFNGVLIGYVWVYGFVEPSASETDWWLLPTVSHQSVSQVLAAFAQTNGIDQQHPALLVLDQARWHTTEKLIVPKGWYLEFLPYYSPELQPAARLWPLVDEPP